MSSRRLVDDFKIRYEENNQRLAEWSERLLDDLDPLDWIQLMSERSYITREILSENEDLLNELWDWIPDPIGEFEAELLYDMVMGMFFDECHDFAIMTRIGEKLLPFFQEQKNYECLAALYHMLGSEYSLFYRVSHDRKGLDTALTYFRKALSLRDHYSEIRMVDIRRFFFEDYAHLISFLDDIHPEQCKEILDLYEEMHNFLNSAPVKEKDGNNPAISEITAVVDEKLLSMVDEAEDMAPWNRDRLFEMTDQLYGNISSSRRAAADDIQARIYYTALWMQDKLDTESYIGKMLAVMERMPEPDFENSDDSDNLRLLNGYLGYSRSVFHALDKEGSGMSEIVKLGFVQGFLPKVMGIMNNVPYLFQTEIMNSLCMEWYEMAEPFLRGEDEKIDFLIRMLIRRQPINYIHSIMVSSISKKLAEDIIDRNPALLVGIRGYSSVTEVVANRQELVDYIGACGQIHDVGKSYIMDVVGRQSRRLFDNEYEMIRRHPKLGLKLVSRDQVLAPYFDIVSGHHKYYDGKHGYPVDVDNTVSPVRVVIDIISIADSIDAGTDNLGRNYAAGKEFSHLMQELREGAGSRYNPDVVSLIDSNDALKEELTTLTSTGRYDVCYQAYQDIAGKTA